MGNDSAVMELPPPPAGFQIDAPHVPDPPTGFTLDRAPNVPEPPPGFRLDATQDVPTAPAAPSGPSQQEMHWAVNDAIRSHVKEMRDRFQLRLPDHVEGLPDETTNVLNESIRRGEESAMLDADIPTKAAYYKALQNQHQADIDQKANALISGGNVFDADAESYDKQNSEYDNPGDWERRQEIRARAKQLLVQSAQDEVKANPQGGARSAYTGAASAAGKSPVMVAANIAGAGGDFGPVKVQQDWQKAQDIARNAEHPYWHTAGSAVGGLARPENVALMAATGGIGGAGGLVANTVGFTGLQTMEQMANRETPTPGKNLAMNAAMFAGSELGAPAGEALAAGRGTAAGTAARFGSKAAAGGAANIATTAAETAINEGRLPTGEETIQAGIGGALPAIIGAKHDLDSSREQSALKTQIIEDFPGLTGREAGDMADRLQRAGVTPETFRPQTKPPQASPLPSPPEGFVVDEPAPIRVPTAEESRPSEFGGYPNEQPPSQEASHAVRQSSSEAEVLRGQDAAQAHPGVREGDTRPTARAGGEGEPARPPAQVGSPAEQAPQARAVSIRPAQEADVAAMVAAQKANPTELGFLPEQALRDRIRAGNATVAGDGAGNVAGFILHGPVANHEIKITQTWVHPDQRGKGVGQQMLSQLEQQAQAKGADRVRAVVRADMAANEFWRKNGYEPVGQKDAGATRGGKLNVLVKELKKPPLIESAEDAAASQARESAFEEKQKALSRGDSATSKDGGSKYGRSDSGQRQPQGNDSRGEGQIRQEFSRRGVEKKLLEWMEHRNESMGINKDEMVRTWKWRDEEQPFELDRPVLPPDALDEFYRHTDNGKRYLPVQYQRLAKHVDEDRWSDVTENMTYEQQSALQDEMIRRILRTREDDLQEAIDTARKHGDPRAQFLAHYHENMPPFGERVPQEWMDAGKLTEDDIGKTFEIHGEKFRVDADEQGNLILRDHITIEHPEELGKIPVDKGSVKAPQEAEIGDEPLNPDEHPATPVGASEASAGRNAGQGSLLGERYEGSNIGSKTGKMFGDTSQGPANAIEKTPEPTAIEQKFKNTKSGELFDRSKKAPPTAESNSKEPPAAESPMFEPKRQDDARITSGPFKGTAGKVKAVTKDGAASIEFTDKDNVTRTRIFQQGTWEKGSGEVLGHGGDVIARQVWGEKSFLKRDVVPKAAETAGAIREAAEDIRRTFAPVTAGEKAKVMGGIVRESAAELAQRGDRAEAALKSASKLFDRLQAADKLAFIDRMERGEDQPTADLRQIAETVRELLDGRRAEVNALGKGKLDHFIQDYFPHIWKDPEKAGHEFAKMLAKRPLEGSKSFLKKRSIPTIKEGIERGLEPVSDNPVDLTLLKIREMDKYILGQKILAEGKQKGLFKFVRATERAPEGYSKIDDKISQVYGPPTITVPEHVDKVVYNALSQTLKNLGVSHERLASLGRKKAGVPGQVLGLSYQGAKRIETKGATELGVIAHELGHQLDDIMGLGKQVLDWRVKYGRQVMALADLHGNHPQMQEYFHRPREMVASVLEAYIHAPQRMQEVAPDVYRAFSDFVDTHHELAPLKDARQSLETTTIKFEKPHGGLLKMGEYYAPDQAADVLNNYLSPGLRNKSGVFRGILGAGNFLNQAQLGLSAYHLGFTSLDAATSKFALGLQHLADGNLREFGKSMATVPLAPIENLVRGDRVLREWMRPGSQGQEMARIVDAMKASGGRAGMDSFYQTNIVKNMMKAFREGNVLGGTLRAPFSLVELAATPIMKWIVPRQKMGIFADMARRELANLPPGATRDKVRSVMGKAWDSVDNRMGQMVYDNLFWNKTAKDLGMASIRSLGWNLGTIRELGGGMLDTLAAGKNALALKKPEFTYRMAYLVALPIVVGGLGAMLQYLYTGQGPSEDKDYFFPKTGEKDKDGNDKRVSLPSYMKDVFDYAHAPGKTLAHKLHPDIGLVADMLQNKDYYGTEIRNADDPFMKQLLDTSAYAGKQFVPFGIRNASQGTTASEKALPFVGITPAPKWLDETAAQSLARELGAENLPRGARSQEKADDSAFRRVVAEDLRHGHSADAEAKIDAEKGAGKLTKEDIESIRARAKYPNDLAWRVSKLEPDAAMKVWAVMTPEEKTSSRGFIQRKIAQSKSLTPEQKGRLLKVLRG